MFRKTAAMMMMFAFVLPAAAQTASDPAAQSVPEKKSCRRIEETGSMMGKRTCHTKSEWAAIDAANATATSRLSDLREHSGGMGARN